MRQQTRRHGGQTADLHTRLDRRRGPALRRLFLAAVIAATIACGTVGHRPEPLDGGTVNGAWLRLVMDDASHGWAETAHALVRTEDGGRRWLAVPLPTAVDLSREPLTAFTGRVGAWLCEQGAARGSSPMPRNPEGDPRNRESPLARCFATGNAGGTWTSGTLPGTSSTFTARTRLDADLTSVAAIDAEHAWVVVRTVSSFAGGGHERINLRDQSLLRTADGGASWTVVRRRVPAEDATPDTPGGVAWVRFADAGTGWLGGFLPGRLEVTHDGGATWQAVSAPMPPPATTSEIVDLKPISFLPNHELVEPVVVGGPTTSYRVTLLLSRDGGRSWAAPPARDIGRTSPAQLDVLDSQHWWIVTGTTFHTTIDEGAHWITFSAKSPVPLLDDVQMTSSQSGLAIGVDPAHAGDRDRGDTTAWRQLLSTTDGARTWRPVAIAGGAAAPASTAPPRL